MHDCAHLGVYAAFNKSDQDTERLFIETCVQNLGNLMNGVQCCICVLPSYMIHQQVELTRLAELQEADAAQLIYACIANAARVQQLIEASLTTMQRGSGNQAYEFEPGLICNVPEGCFAMPSSRERSRF